MKPIFSEKTATYGIILILGPMVIFHLLVLAGVIPFHIVWGGRLQSQDEMIRFESISILSLLIILFFVSVNAGIIQLKIGNVVQKIVLWMVAALFLLNTLGNLAAETELERNVFTPATLLLFLFCLRLALAKNSNNQSKVQ